MSFISYAQNFEDVMLWRALKHVQKGFYIDVGAWSPNIDSVTRLFYENNWRGINVEPNPEFHAQYGIKRPEDINLKVAVGDREGCVLINFMSNPGLSTAVDQFAKQHESAGWTIDKQEVSMTTLAAICKQHIKENQDIHFLKVDVEGLEEAALRGNDWTTYRPWIVLVEATLPMTQVESYQEWESILINAGYAFAYADGLNRFYVANQHAELLDSFRYPPNVFDSFVLNSQQEAEAKAQQAEVKVQQAEVKVQKAEAKAQQAEVKAQKAEAKAQQAEAEAQQAIDQAQQAQVQAQTIAAQLKSTYTSRSWRLTAPLRQLMNLLRSFK
jgi:FkbM family methyltransferase